MRLTEISEYKLDKLEDYFRQKENIVELFAHNPNVENFLRLYDVYLSDNIVRLEERIDLHLELKEYLEYYTYGQNLLYDLFLVNKNGEIVFSVMEEQDLGSNLITGPLKDTNLAETFRKAVSLSAADLSRFEFYTPSGEMAAFMGAPVFRDGELLGAACIQIIVDDIFEMAQDYTGLGDTGETVIAAQEGGQLKILAPLRHDKDAAFNKIITIGDMKGKPIQIASKAAEGVQVSIDYRGEEVFAVSRYLFYTDWGVVVKMDTSEIFAAAQKYKQWMIMLGILTFLVVVAVAIVVSRSISRPIVRLQNAIIRVADGDLTQTVDIKQKDEIGLLAMSFNSMAHDLGISHDELTKRTKSLEKANEEVKTFAYIVSHDLRSPLVNLKGFSGELSAHLNTVKSALPETLAGLDDETRKKVGISLDDKIPHALHFINTSVDKMDGLVGAILKLSRLGHKKLNLQSIDTNKLMSKIVDAVSFQLNEKGARVVVGQLPEVKADLLSMEQVFSNILTNAINYLEPERPGVIEIGAKDNETETVFHIKDNGRGIAEDEMHKVFEIFRRAGRQNVKGEGMGLAYVRTLIHLHRGEIKCASTFGQGSTFAFTLPKDLKEEVDCRA